MEKDVSFKDGKFSITNYLKMTRVTERIESAAADAGYWSEENMREVDPEGPELDIATQKERIQRQVPAEGATTEDPPSADLSPKERMERKLRTSSGHNIYRKRGQTVEPFGELELTIGLIAQDDDEDDDLDAARGRASHIHVTMAIRI